MKILFELVQVLLCILEVYLIFDFFLAFFPLRRIFDQKNLQIAFVLGTSVCVRFINMIGSSVVNIVGMQFIYIALLTIAFYGPVFKKLFCYLMTVAIMVGSEFLWIILMGLPSNFSMQQVKSNFVYTIFTMLCIRLITFILFTFAKRISGDSSSELTFNNLLIYSIVPASTLVVMVCIAYMNIDFSTRRSIQVILILGAFSLIVGDIMIFHIFDKYLKSVKRMKTQELLIAKLEMEERHYEQIENANQEHAKFIHDIRHQINVIGEMAAENNAEDILKVLAELNVKISDTESEMLCQNRLLNAILNEKKKEAEQKHIAIKIKMEPGFCIDRIDGTDLIALIGNLLENAVEAADKCEEGFIRAYFFSQNDNYFSVVKIVNNYIGDIAVENGCLKTSKNDHTRHGFGVSSVGDVAEKYGGYLKYFFENGVFTAVVILPVAS